MTRPFLLLAALASLTFVGCGHTSHPTPTPPATENANEAEAVARTLVEVWGTYDYRDQESRYERVLPLLASERRAQWPAFQVDQSAVAWQIIGNTTVTAARVDSESDDRAVVIVTAEDYSRYVPYESSRVVEKWILQQVEVSLVLEDGHWLVTEWRALSEQPLNQSGTPTGAVTPIAPTTPTPN
ncbi:MAG: hypothetical protein ABSC13_05980 [Dehalococcoidia bacterium]|jgi:hypothetical protein